MSEAVKIATIQATTQIIATIILQEGVPGNLTQTIRDIMAGFEVPSLTKEQIKEQIVAKVRLEFPYFREYANKIQAIKRLRELARELDIEIPLKEAKEEVESWDNGFSVTIVE